MWEELSEYVENLDVDNDEEYLFYRQCDDKPIDQRSREISVIINDKLKNTKAIKKSEGLQYTSHLFRKTMANKEYKEGLKKLETKISAKLGHKGISNVKHYVDKI